MDDTIRKTMVSLKGLVSSISDILNDPVVIERHKYSAGFAETLQRMVADLQELHDRKDKKAIKEFFYVYTCPNVEEELRRIDIEGHEALNKLGETQC